LPHFTHSQKITTRFRESASDAAFRAIPITCLLAFRIYSIKLKKIFETFFEI